MFAPRLIRLAAFSVIALAGLTAAASASMGTATTSTAANLRTGPGTSYSVITSLPEGTDVTVDACTLAWCAVETDEGDGFVAKSLLDFLGDGDNGDDDGPIIITPEPEPTQSDAEVCFYQQKNFMGANFCVYPGDQDEDIPGNFDDNIESILISGGASVEVCTDTDFGGECKTYDHSVKKLPSYLRDDITSYTVTGDSYPDDSDADQPDDGNVIVLQ
jgi:hypothetical protein